MWKLLFTLVLTSLNMFVMAQLHHHHNRRILHQLISPTSQPTFPSPPTKQNFFPFYPSPPPPLTTTPLPTFPANISSLVLPKPSPSKHISQNLIVVAVSLSFLSATLIAFATVFLLYHRRHRHHHHHQCFIHKKSSSSASLPLFPPNTDYHSEQKLNSPDLLPLSSMPTHNFWESYHDVKQEEVQVEVFFSPIGSPGNLKTTSLTPSNSCTPTPEKKSGERETHNLSPRVSNLSGEYEPSPSKEVSLNLPKLKSLRWENVRGSSNRAVEWDKLKSTSFRLSEESIEKLFAMNYSNLTTPRSVHLSMNQENRVLDPKKSQNIAILLRALNVTTDEVCEALLEGNTDIVGTELLESLLRMAPTKEEEHKLQEYEDASPFKLGPAEKFLKAILDIPFAFKRVQAMLYIANFDSELDHLKRSFETLELACEELRNSQMLTKLLEAVLNTGNHMNIEANYRDTQVFKLDTLLKLVHIKGTDGKTTLLHFVVQEIIRSEGSRISSTNHNPTTEKTPQSTFRDDVEFSKIGLEVVSGLSRELTNVKNAAAMDSNVLNSEVTKLALGITQIKDIVKLNEEFELKERFKNFLESMNSFLNNAEEEIIEIQARECVVLLMVKEITKDLNGNSAHEEAHPFRIFTVVRDFVSVLDQVCKEVGKINERSIVSSAPQFPMLVNSSFPPVFRRLSGRWERSSSSNDNDDESSSSP